MLEDGYYFDGFKMVPFKEFIIQSDTIVSINNKRSNYNCKRIALEGKYIIPGLVDAHIHLSGCPAIPYVNIPEKVNANSLLKCGVTTAVDLFFSEYECVRFKKLIDSLPNKYSTVLLSGPILTAPNGHGTEYGVETRTITNPIQAKKITNEVIDNGVDVIKLVYEAYSGKNAIDKEMLNVIVATAHNRDIKVFAHINVVQEAMDCINAKVDVLAHLPYDTLTPAHLDKIKSSGIIVIPTLSVIKSYYKGHNRDFTSDSLLWQTTAEEYLTKFKRNSGIEALHPNPAFAQGYTTNLSLLIHKQIPILSGTDAGNYAVFFGYSLHDELYQYVAAGMTPAEAINTSSRNMKKLFPNWKSGILKSGYRADVVILNKNPLLNIRHTKTIFKVIHKGRLLSDNN